MTRVGMWYDVGGNVHTVVADDTGIPGNVRVRNEGGDEFSVPATLIDEVAEMPKGDL